MSLQNNLTHSLTLPPSLPPPSLSHFPGVGLMITVLVVGHMTEAELERGIITTGRRLHPLHIVRLATSIGAIITRTTQAMKGTYSIVYP